MAGTAVTSLRSTTAAATSDVVVSMVCNGDMSVEIGFMATRTTIGSPLVMPPSRPPARLVTRCTLPVMVRPGAMVISSCTSAPVMRADSNPMPISTPLTAGMDSMA